MLQCTLFFTLLLLLQPFGRASVLSSSEPGVLGGQPGGYNLAATNYIGWSFDLNSTTTIGSYGAMIYRGVGTSGTFTAQLVQLATSASLPSGSPFLTSETLLVQTNSISLKALDNYQFTLSSPLTLNAGSYALILAATTTNAVTVATNSVDHSGVRYFRWNGSQWQNGGIQNVHLAVYSVPEPETVKLFIAALVLLGLRLKKKRYPRTG